MITNAYYIKFTGKANIPEQLAIGEAYKVLIDGEITTETASNNQDGTQDVTYKFEPMTAEIVTEHGQTIKAKDMRGNSTKLRKVLYALWSNKASSKDFDLVYTDFTNLIIKNADNLIDKVL